ncbi:MAG: FAD-dependent oxidoreductase [Rhodoferax sp.]|nr:FAD-dependent oxidoreductase [Rhodoferax sp.]
MRRRQFVQAGLTATLPLAACTDPANLTHIGGGFVGVDVARGHRLRDALRGGTGWPAPTKVLRTEVVVAGAGVAGLAAARALRLRGIEDFAVLELEDAAGGNSRSSTLGGMACPLGAHYLPLPGDDAPEVQDLLESLGLRQRIAGRWQYDERHLCHSPQERLFFQGEWQDGLLPLQGVGPQTLAQYQRFALAVDQAHSAGHWSIPVRRMRLSPTQRALAAISFEAYLNQHQLTDAHLGWYLDYCCRDDYGAGLSAVSAWAGLHYFASRHGFHAPGSDGPERDGLLTWPEGNGWLTRQLALPLGQRLHTGRMVLRVADTRSGVEVDAFNVASQSVERWQARSAVVALPLHVAARVVEDAPQFLLDAAKGVVHAPWLVANLQLRAPLHDRPGAAPSWDNVLYGDAQTAPGLGYVDAMHQSLRPVPGATVLTYYRALGLSAQGSLPVAASLLNKTWGDWRNDILAELSQAHPDLAAKTVRLDICRYGHAMAVPLPTASGQVGFAPAAQPNPRSTSPAHYPPRSRIDWHHLRFAHSDWAGYSVFEEAFTAGHAAGCDSK